MVCSKSIFNVRDYLFGYLYMVGDYYMFKYGFINWNLLIIGFIYFLRSVNWIDFLLSYKLLMIVFLWWE